MGENLQQEFGPYTLEELIARGGMAEIYRATVTGIGGFEKTVAIKKILPHLAEDDEFIAMLADEARIIESLDHANIAQVFDLGEIDGSYYIAMEYIHGVDLADIVDELEDHDQRVPLPHIVHITSSICAGLHAAHSKTDAQGNPLDIVHRDISLHNVLVSFAGEVKIIDFGVAKAADRDAETKMGVIKGKLLYMAPEQAKADDLDGRADLFAAGLCAYKMLTGHLPFEGDNEFQVYNNVLSKDIAPPSEFRPEVPEELDRIVMKLLRRDPDERYQEGYAAKQELDRLLHELDPGYNVNRLSRYVEENFSHLLRQRSQASASSPANRAPATPSNPAAETGNRGAGQLGEPSADQSDPHQEAVRQEVPAGGDGAGSDPDKTVAATPDSLTGSQPEPAPDTPGSAPAQPPSPGKRTETDSSSTGEFDIDTGGAAERPAERDGDDAGLPWVVWAIGALIVLIAGLVGYKQFLGDSASTGNEDRSPQSATPSDGPAADDSPSMVRISLDSSPSGARLLVKGEEVGRTPHRVPLPKSDKPLKLELRKDGFERRVLQLTPRRDLNKTVELKRLETAGKAAPSKGTANAKDDGSSESTEDGATEGNEDAAPEETTAPAPSTSEDPQTAPASDSPGDAPDEETVEAAPATPPADAPKESPSDAPAEPASSDDGRAETIDLGGGDGNSEGSDDSNAEDSNAEDSNADNASAKDGARQAPGEGLLPSSGGSEQGAEDKDDKDDDIMDPFAQ